MLRKKSARSVQPHNTATERSGRETLVEISQHSVGRNIECRTVVSLLEALASVDEVHHGRFLVTPGDATETFEPPKQIDCRTVMSLLNALASADEAHRGRFLVTPGDATGTFEPTEQKDKSEQGADGR